MTRRPSKLPRAEEVARELFIGKSESEIRERIRADRKAVLERTQERINKALAANHNSWARSIALEDFAAMLKEIDRT